MGAMMAAILSLSSARAQQTTYPCQIQKYLNPQAGYFDFGLLAAADGNLFAVATEPTNSDPGSTVHVFRREGATLLHEGQLLTPVEITPGGPTADYFTQALAVDGDTLVTGDRFFSIFSGRVLVFRRNAGVWSRTDIIDPPTLPNSDANMEFGTAVAIEGNVLVVTAGYMGIGHADVLGGVFIYRHDGAQWNLTQIIPNPTSQPFTSAAFGVAAVLKNGRLAFTASNESNDPSDPGAAYIYQDGPNGFVPEATLQPELHPSTVDDLTSAFGASIAIDADICVVSAPGTDRSVFVWHKVGGMWQRVQKILSPAVGPSRFGKSLAVRAGTTPGDPSRIYIGDPLNFGAGNSAGAVYVYEGVGPYSYAWAFYGSDTTTSHGFGMSLALSEGALLVGAPGANAAYLFGPGFGTDCNADGVQDLCEIAAGAADTNADGVPDSCAPACAADFNNSGGVSVQDIFDFLAAYFGNDPAVDVNNSGTISVQDIFDFLAAYFSGC
jgi:hypothetical protein